MLIFWKLPETRGPSASAWRWTGGHQAAKQTPDLLLFTLV